MPDFNLSERVIASTRQGYHGFMQTWLGTESNQFLTPVDIPREDAQIMADFYSNLPEEQRIPGLNVINIISSIGFRIYQEWCMDQEKKDPEKKPWNWHADEVYDRENYPGFRDFVTNENHLELDRNSGRRGRQFEWDLKTQRFKNFNDEHYQRSRSDVIRGLVLRAIDCHSRWGSLHPPKGCDENLRNNLTSYVQNAEVWYHLMQHPD